MKTIAQAIVDNGDIPIASEETLGGVMVGDGLSITDAGVLSASGDIPIASEETLGGVMVGDGLSITDAGVLSAAGGGGGNDIFIIEYQGTTLLTPKADILAAYDAGKIILIKRTIEGVSYSAYYLASYDSLNNYKQITWEQFSISNATSSTYKFKYFQYMLELVNLNTTSNGYEMDATHSS